MGRRQWTEYLILRQQLRLNNSWTSRITSRTIQHWQKWNWTRHLIHTCQVCRSLCSGVLSFPSSVEIVITRRLSGSWFSWHGKNVIKIIVLRYLRLVLRTVRIQSVSLTKIKKHTSKHNSEALSAIRLNLTGLKPRSIRTKSSFPAKKFKSPPPSK